MIGVESSPTAGPTGSTTTRSSPSTARSSASDVRRAVGRLPPPGSDRDVRDLPRPRGDPGGRGARPRGPRLDLPELPRLRDRPAARPAGRDDPPVVARPPVRLVEPRGRQRRVDLRPDRDAGPTRRGPRLGPEAEGIGRGRADAVRRRRDLRGRVPRGREHRRGHEGAARPPLQQQPVGDLDAAQRPDRRRAAFGTRRSATACRRSVSTGTTCSRSTRRSPREWRAPARATGRRSSRP